MVVFLPSCRTIARAGGESDNDNRRQSQGSIFFVPPSLHIGVVYFGSRGGGYTEREIHSKFPYFA
jgi:hypothetical protein